MYQSGALADSIFTEGANCSCSGFIKEVFYKVYISPREPKTGVSTVTSYAIDDIYMDLVIQSQPLA